MATFAELCRDVARESGTVPAWESLTLVEGLTGREARIKAWVAQAWRMIQIDRNDWRWMEATFEGTTNPGQRAYQAQGLGITERFADWVLPDDIVAFTVQHETEARAHEVPLGLMDWPAFHAATGVGEPETGRPSLIAVDGQRLLHLDPIPDGRYIIRGRYRQAPQALAASADRPEAPERYHLAIQWRALMLMAQFDEAVTQYPAFAREYDGVMSQMLITELPPVRLPYPLA